MNTALNFDKIKGRPVLRTRRPGDLFLWRGHHRKVKKLLCDTGVPCSVRDRLPMLCDGEGIVLIPGIGVRDGAAAQTDVRPLYVSIAPFDPMMEI
jgi:tRNA(Ile)-lysidine synthetase-like protein